MKKILLIGWVACVFVSNLFSGDSVDSRANDFDHLDDDGFYVEGALVTAPKPEDPDDITDMLRAAGYHVGDDTRDDVFPFGNRQKAKPSVPRDSYDSELIDLNEVLRARGYDLGDNLPEMTDLVASQGPVEVVYGEPVGFGGAGSSFQPKVLSDLYLDDMDYLEAQV